MNDTGKILLAFGVGYLLGNSKKKDGFTQGQLVNPYTKENLLRYKRTAPEPSPIVKRPQYIEPVTIEPRDAEVIKPIVLKTSQR